MARLFDGIDDRIDLANETNFDFERTQTFTFSFFWYPTANASQGLVCKANNDGDALGITSFQRVDASNPTVALSLANSSADRLTCYTTNSFAQNTWHHVVITYSGNSAVSGVNIYVNGVDEALTTITDALTATILNNNPLQLGCRGGTVTPGFFFGGSMADVAVWNVELTMHEANMLGGGAEPSTIRGSSAEVALLRLCGTDSPEIDDWGTNDGTLTATTQATHPLNSPSACNPQQVLRSTVSNLRW